MIVKGIIFVIGGVGYIGLYMIVELFDNGYDVVIVDNFVNSKVELVCWIEWIMGKMFVFYQVDVCDEVVFVKVFDVYLIIGMIYFVVFKVVGELVVKLFEYYQNNIGGLFVVFKVMCECNVRQFVFSLFVIVYGVFECLLIDELFLLFVMNLYGQLKFIVEQILCDFEVLDLLW